MSKFCQNNLTSIEFFPFSFFAKDLKIWTPLVSGRNRNGLYEWPNFTVNKHTIQVTTTTVPRRVWHRHLGRSHSRILYFVLNKFSLPVSLADKFTLYNSCCSNKVQWCPFGYLSLNGTSPLQIIFNDLWGLSPVLFIDKK